MATLSFLVVNYTQNMRYPLMFLRWQKERM